MSEQEKEASFGFITTKEYRRFAEFCDSCRRYRYIGLCYGPPGVGKTLSAQHYAHWDVWEQLLGPLVDTCDPPLEEVLACQTLLYTPSVVNTPKIIEKELRVLNANLKYLQANAIAKHHEQDNELSMSARGANLIIIDESERLKMAGLEQVRDLYDRGQWGLVLIGMPGIEKRLSRYPQFYSRVGFVHQFRPLSKEEMHFILENTWEHLGVKLQPDDFTDAEAIATVIRVTGGNFRLLQRLCTQIERILHINDLHLITKEVVEAAREQLVIGQM